MHINLNRANAYIGVVFIFLFFHFIRVLEEGNIRSITLETYKCLPQPTHHPVHKSVFFTCLISLNDFLPNPLSVYT